MSHHVEFDSGIVTDLFTSQLIISPLSIRADLGDHYISASLIDDGSVIVGEKHYTNLQLAMDSIPRQHIGTSNAWQFWTWFSPDRHAWTPLEHIRAGLVAEPGQAEIRTSGTHPLRIDSVIPPYETAGRIGLTFCPGKCSEGLYGGTWKRDLHEDIKAIEAWGCEALISLMEDHEFKLLDVPDFAQAMSTSPMQWVHLPIQDMQTPDAQFEKQWDTLGPDLHKLLSTGNSIVIHCRGGLGRTGLLAARILVEAGLQPVDAIADVRQTRTHAIETYAQENYILSKEWNE